MIAAKYAAGRGLCPADLPQRQAALLRRYGLPTETPFDADVLYETAVRDKKREKDEIDVVIPASVGKCVLHRLPVTALRDFLCEGC